MTLNKKVLIIVGVAFLCVVGVLYAITSNIVLGSFAKLEEQNVRTNVKRVQNAFQDKLAELNSTAGDWAPWNETRDFVLGENKTYIDDNLMDVTLVNLRLNFMIFINSSGQLIHAKGVDLIEEKDKSVSKALITLLLGKNSLLQHTNQTDSKKGIILLPENPILIAAWPISDNELKGPINGTLIVGRYLDDKEIQNLMEKTELSISLVRVDSSTLSADFETAHSLFSEETPVVVQELNTETIAGYTELTDISGNPCLFVRVEMPRDILRHGRNSTNYFMLVLLSVGAIFLITLFFTLQTTVLGPIAKLTNHTLAIGKSGDLSARLSMQRQDEIGTLASEFDSMLSQLEKRSEELKEVNTKLQEDIDKRKRAEKALIESEERYSAVIKQSSEGIYLLDPDTKKILEANRSFQNIIGYSSEEISKHTIYDFLAHDKRDIDTKIQKAVQKKYYIVSDRKYRHKDGKVLDLEARSNLISISGKDILCVIVRDITEHKRFQEEKARLEVQLKQSQKMESIGTLSGGIAHDFNNILGIIIGNTELALDDVPEWNRAHFNLEEIKTASIRAKDIVRQLLSFSRKTARERKPIKIIPVIKESLKFLRATIPTSIDIRQDIQAKGDTILADPTQIHQIMMNLCTNASHAMETGGTIEVGIENVVLDEDSTALYTNMIPDNCVKVTVSDTGQGIAPKTIDRIFDPYFTTKEVGKGSGMGLSVVHGIVKSHGGAISVESELGKGTTFSVLFHLIDKEAVVEAETDEELPIGNERILFVDDEESMVYVGRYRLERLGYQVETKTSPVQALKLFQAKHDQFDLVITDMTMPQMTGDILVREILKIRPDMPTIMCTGFSEKIDEERSKELGISAYIEKPLDRRDLAKLVRKVLDEK